MFNNSEDEYLKATQDAQVNIHANKSTFRGLVVVWNLFLLGSFTFIGYLGFNYLKDEGTIFNDTVPSKTAVMGVSDTKSDIEYLKMLNSMENDIVNEKDLSMLSEKIENVVNTSTPNDDSLYTQAISKEIDSDIYHKNSRVILVEKGDSLGSISEKYYGSPLEFDKIIKANKELNHNSQVIHIGQKLNIPY
ncbi:hypothetical protein MNB_SV-14-1008 [hydrothermal vent metagenome]|uniref:LysM domain-containing protein n=1 Tax=hydrothermal vent metagenome TaxID=652676 RepID=A0A1W1CER0_9ZZZZ